jgi:hypothetical protein
MSLNDVICESLRAFGPSAAGEISVRIGADFGEVDRRLRVMFPSRVRRCDAGWRLVDVPADTALANMAMSLCHVVDGLARQAGAGV